MESAWRSWVLERVVKSECLCVVEMARVARVNRETARAVREWSVGLGKEVQLKRRSFEFEFGQYSLDIARDPRSTSFPGSLVVARVEDPRHIVLYRVFWGDVENEEDGLSLEVMRYVDLSYGDRFYDLDEEEDEDDEENEYAIVPGDDVSDDGGENSLLRPAFSLHRGVFEWIQLSPDAGRIAMGCSISYKRSLVILHLLSNGERKVPFPVPDSLMNIHQIAMGYEPGTFAVLLSKTSYHPDKWLVFDRHNEPVAIPFAANDRPVRQSEEIALGFIDHFASFSVSGRIAITSTGSSRVAIVDNRQDSNCSEQLKYVECSSNGVSVSLACISTDERFIFAALFPLNYALIRISDGLILNQVSDLPETPRSLIVRSLSVHPSGSIVAIGLSSELGFSRLELLDISRPPSGMKVIKSIHMQDIPFVDELVWLHPDSHVETTKSRQSQQTWFSLGVLSKFEVFILRFGSQSRNLQKSDFTAHPAGSVS